MTPEEMAAELRKAGWQVAPPITQASCLHAERDGGGSVGTGGSSFWWRCKRCGKYESETLPAAYPPQFAIALGGLAASSATVSS